LDYKYNIKVTDFGLSNIYASGKMLTTACGSPSYACPEMLCSRPYDGLKADIWSLGIVLYAMCFGYLPFDNPNISELYKMIKMGEF
jgi:serine/threonine protein kinase